MNIYCKVKYFGIILILSLVLLSCWWYGLFSDWGKISQVYDYTKEEFSDYGVALSNEKVQEARKKISYLTTDSIIQSLYLWGRKFANEVYLYPTVFTSESISDCLIQELFQRNNSAQILLAYYQDIHVRSDLNYNDIVSRFAILEWLLARPEIVLHLSQEDKAHLLQLAAQKQIEKITNPDYGEYFAVRNYIYTDTYDENEWIEEKLQERMDFFLHYADGEKNKYCITPHKTSSMDDDMHMPNVRFDFCTVIS